MKFIQLQQLFFLTLLFGTTAFFLWMLGSYLFPVFWAVVITIVFYPIYERLVRWFGGRESLSSVLTILVAIAVVVIPIVSIGGLVVKESLDLYRSLSNGSHQETVSGLVGNLNGLSDYLAIVNVEIETVEAWVKSNVASIGQTIGNSLILYSQLTLGFTVKIGITLYLIFFMFKYGNMIREKLLFYLPLQDKYEALLFKRFAETTQAIVQGTLMIAIIQGTIGGLMLWLAGIGAPVLWGVVMTLLSIIPALGPSLVLFPAGIYLILTGAIRQGALMLGVGIMLVGLVDEFLRPVLVGRRAKIPDAVVLLATVGGLASFGISGFVIGPVLAAFCLSLWVIFGEKYKTELDGNQ